MFAPTPEQYIKSTLESLRDKRCVYIDRKYLKDNYGEDWIRGIAEDWVKLGQTRTITAITNENFVVLYTNPNTILITIE